MAHRDHILGAVHGVLGAAVLILCLAAELSVLVLRRHAALYLLPVCAMLTHLWRSGRRAGIGLVDFAYLKPPRRLRVTIPGLLEHLRLIGCFDDGSVEFMSRVVEDSGMGDETYFPPALHYLPPSATHADAVQEAGMLFFPTLDELFAKTGVPPSAVGALVVNCSGFGPAPSLAAIIANRYRMPTDVKTFNLSGMGCAAGIVGVDVARGVLRAHAGAVDYAVVGVWAPGKDQRTVLFVPWVPTYFHFACLVAVDRRVVVWSCKTCFIGGGWGMVRTCPCILQGKFMCFTVEQTPHSESSYVR
ncbi:unnamed protein product [Triticum turgidum subsp. durum]|uniref:FAE domain-containing protein n=1 Tax=Triticum turgidum subsp. durum TaxID=4567 RepID=A0A9R0TWX5_TRITD|nr:unnamed protein product [Triticum turgidum subsp. durum]